MPLTLPSAGHSRHYECNHVSAIFSHNSYGESLINKLPYLAKENDICLDFVEAPYCDFAQPDFLKLSEELMIHFANYAHYKTPTGTCTKKNDKALTSQPSAYKTTNIYQVQQQ